MGRLVTPQLVAASVATAALIMTGVHAQAGGAAADIHVSCHGGTPHGYSKDQLRNAATIVAVGRDMGIPQRGQVVAIATAMQESSLRNLDGGDRDSVGLFQQRPSQGWGTYAQVHDPAHAARSFYTSLQKVNGWQHMPVTQAAQAVQKSAFPGAYAKHTDAAAQLVGCMKPTNT